MHRKYCQWLKKGEKEIAILLACLATLCPADLFAQPFAYGYDAGGNLTNLNALVAGEPMITTAPQSQLIEGGGASISVVASGAGLAFQWLSNGVAITGATNDTLTFSNIPPFLWATNGGIAIASNVLTLTDGNVNEAHSAYFAPAQTITNFSAAFTYQEVGTNGAGGFAFVVQNSGAASAALGSTGGYLGYSGVSPSVAIEFNTYSSSPGGMGFAFTTNGLTPYNGGPSYAKPGLVNLGDGDPINVSVVYSNGSLSLSLTDSIAGTSFSTNYAVNLAAALGSQAAYVGFSAGSSSPATPQHVGNFTFSTNGVPAISGFSMPAVVYSVQVSNTSGLVISQPVSLWTDVNNNGMPDWWELMYFHNLNQLATGDFDGDGVNNLNEYLEGTNPTNAASYNPRLNIQTLYGEVFAEPDQPYYAMGQFITLTAIPDPGYTFMSWSGTISGSKTNISFEITSNTTVNAAFDVPLATALGNPSLAWTTAGAASWFGQAAVSVNGGTAAQSGLIYDNQQSTLQATVSSSQAMDLIFSWDVSCVAPDALTFSLDGTTYASISGTSNNWQQVQIFLIAGNHTLLWTYAKNGGDGNIVGIPYADAAWVDNVSVTPVPGACDSAPTGLVSLWRAEGTTLDSAGTNNGLLVNGAGYATGIVGEAFNFNGASQFVQIADAPSLRPASFTLECWFASSNSSGALITKPVGTGSLDSFALWLAGNNLNGVISSGTASSTTLSYPFKAIPGVWYHAAFTYDTNSHLQSLYLNGALAATNSATITPGFDSHPLLIGGDNDGGSPSLPFTGFIDEAGIFNRALAAGEISGIYGAGNAGICPIATTTAPFEFGQTNGASGLQWSTSGFQMTLTGLTGQGPVIIYASTNLLTWVPIYTNAPAVGTIQFLDATATNMPRRFYRALQQ